MARSTRDHVRLKFEADGPEVPGAISRFRLDKVTEHQYQAREGGRWIFESADRETLAGDLSREAVAALIADAADWLSYVERG